MRDFLYQIYIKYYCDFTTWFPLTLNIWSVLTRHAAMAQVDGRCVWNVKMAALARVELKRFAKNVSTALGWKDRRQNNVDPNMIRSVECVSKG